MIKDDGTRAITILRAVGEMGGWGDFVTPEAQYQVEVSEILKPAEIRSYIIEKQ